MSEPSNKELKALEEVMKMAKQKTIITTEAGKFTLPKAITYRQYFLLKKKFDTIKEKLAEEGKSSDPSMKVEAESLKLNLGGIIQVLFNEGIIPFILATVLVPCDEEGNPNGKWKSAYSDNEDLFLDVTDQEVFEVVNSFLFGRENLIQGLMNFFNLLSLPNLK